MPLLTVTGTPALKQGSWDQYGADRTQVGPMLAPCTLLSGYIWYHVFLFQVLATHRIIVYLQISSCGIDVTGVHYRY